MEQVDEYEERKADKKMNGLLAGIGVLALFSVLVDGSDFIEKIQGHGIDGVDMGDCLHLLFYLAIAAVIFFVWFFGFKRDE